MKKSIKVTVSTLVVGFALTGAGGTVLAATGYLHWGGTSAYEGSMTGLDKIKAKGLSIKEERDVYKQASSDLENTVKDKDNLLNSKEQEIEAKQKEINQLKNAQTNNSDQLKQAETDMKSVEQKTNEVLNSLN